MLGILQELLHAEPLRTLPINEEAEEAGLCLMWGEVNLDRDLILWRPSHKCSGDCLENAGCCLRIGFMDSKKISFAIQSLPMAAQSLPHGPLSR